MYMYITDLRTMSQADVQARVDVEDAGARTFPVARVAVAKLGMYFYIYIYINECISRILYIYTYMIIWLYTHKWMYIYYLYHAIR